MTAPSPHGRRSDPQAPGLPQGAPLAGGYRYRPIAEGKPARRAGAAARNGGQPAIIHGTTRAPPRISQSQRSGNRRDALSCCS